jgi:hypothetical protein
MSVPSSRQFHRALMASPSTQLSQTVVKIAKKNQQPNFSTLTTTLPTRPLVSHKSQLHLFTMPVSSSFLLFATSGQRSRILPRLALIPFLSLLYHACLDSFSYLFEIVINRSHNIATSATTRELQFLPMPWRSEGRRGTKTGTDVHWESPRSILLYTCIYV